MGHAGASSQPVPMFQRGMYASEVGKVSSDDWKPDLDRVDWRPDLMDRVSDFALMHKILTLQRCCGLNSNYC